MFRSYCFVQTQYSETIISINMCNLKRSLNSRFPGLRCANLQNGKDKRTWKGHGFHILSVRALITITTANSNSFFLTSHCYSIATNSVASRGPQVSSTTIESWIILIPSNPPLWHLQKVLGRIGKSLLRSRISSQPVHMCDLTQ